MRTQKLALTCLFTGIAAVHFGCSSLTSPPEPRAAATAESSAKGEGAKADGSGKLGINDLVVGKGAEAKTGDKVKVNYTGTLTNGTEFDSSKKPGRTPFEVVLGRGGVIKGWDQGLPGMKVGGKRKLTIPGDLAYGPSGRPPTIPPNATLIFEIDMLEISPGGK
jgi:FKBP-type peptidyl-prolyl cis-trans isomerase